jgi:hypothetical protein
MSEQHAGASKTEEPLVILCRIGQYQQAEMVRQALEAESIPCTIDGGNSAALWGLGAEGPFAAKILVRQGDRPRAVELLKQIETEGGMEIDVIEEE